jgi:hypothetical protein
VECLPPLVSADAPSRALLVGALTQTISFDYCLSNLFPVRPILFTLLDISRCRQKTGAMRDTIYARELATASHRGARLERIFVKKTKTEEIRFSWWKDSKMMMRPLDLPEDELLSLIEKGLNAKVFTDRFVINLIKLLVK